jgi:hypothetical protein
MNAKEIAFPIDFCDRSVDVSLRGNADARSEREVDAASRY